ncbi:hypothetical protein GCM10027275_00640 [Rhabdobacter roseus]|uniref:Uncharacterized protein n=1 Tax=Rhabdobacter roseus TaxID=1655419 RepID=A0A840TPJ9_9BACT|nr:hypothetical protein [Rhabdobacter roseus]MBB5281948.1 hypothetical protein [Rhabdobacter roseus]
MTHKILIETQTDTDFELIVGLARRLGLHTRELPIESSENLVEQEQILKDLYGSWQSEESGDELAAMIQQARQDTPRDIEL